MLSLAHLKNKSKEMEFFPFARELGQLLCHRRKKEKEDKRKKTKKRRGHCVSCSCWFTEKDQLFRLQLNVSQRHRLKKMMEWKKRLLFLFVCVFVVGFCCFVKSEHKEQTNIKLADNPRDAIVPCCYVVFVGEETGGSSRERGWNFNFRKY